MLACFTRGFPLFSDCVHTACLLLSRCASRGPDVLLDRMTLLFQFCLCLLKIASIPDHHGVEDEREGRGSVQLGLVATIREPPLSAKGDRSCHRVQGLALVEPD